MIDDIKEKYCFQITGTGYFCMLNKDSFKEGMFTFDKMVKKIKDDNLKKIDIVFPNDEMILNQKIDSMEINSYLNKL